MNKIMLVTGSLVGYAYAMEFFIAWYGANPYAGYDSIDSSPIFQTKNADDERLPPKERVVFIERGDVRAELDRPLDETLTAPLTPGVGEIQADEQSVIDRTTRSRIYEYSYLQAQDGSPVMVLTPALS
jgi:hypothetical protein